MIRLTKPYKWDYYRVVEGLYSVLPPEKIRSRCGVNYAQSIFPDLREDLKKLNVRLEQYPNFSCDSEEQVEKVITVLNKKWNAFLEEEIIKYGL